MILTLTSPTPSDTLALGRRFAAVLVPGDIVLVSGRLGAGKTLFVSGVAEGLGIPEPVTSPTFIISRIYRSGFIPLVHADVYRLGTVAEFEDLELPDEAAEGALIVEWGDAIADSVGPDRMTVHIEIEPSGRSFTFLPGGSWRDRSLEMLT